MAIKLKKTVTLLKRHENILYFLFFDKIYHAFAGDGFKLGARAIAEKCSAARFLSCSFSL